MNSNCFGIFAIFVAVINVNSVNAIDSGTENFNREVAFGEEAVDKDEWPFIAALYNSETFEYVCGGTILSHKHVLTSAHCVQTKGKGVALTPDEITVRLGAFNLTDRSEADAVNRRVREIFVHPDWKYNEQQRYDANIAILVLNENLTFSDHIRPVFIPPADFLLDELRGEVVGWGKPENGTAEGTPRKIGVFARNDKYCYEPYTDYDNSSIASEGAFCGEGRGSPNEGHSGGGFFGVAGSGWVQLGIVTFIRPKETKPNRRMTLTLYMKLTFFRDWIAEMVGKSGGTVSLAATTADLNCTYKYSSQGTYGCRLFDLNIRQEYFEVKNFNGKHDVDKGNDDVEMISFETGVMVSPPRNFGNIFRNLKELTISKTRRIDRSNFQNLEGLESIALSDCSIPEFDANSLWDLTNLQSFRMTKCGLKLLHASTFSLNRELTKVTIDSNPLTSLPRNLFQNNLMLESVYFQKNSIETIDENIFETNVNLSFVLLEGNRLRHLSKNLFRNNPQLRYIDFWNNRIKTVDEGSLTANSKVSFLILAYNELESLPANLLQGMERLGVIYLQNNALRAIDEHFFSTNAQISLVDLGANQLSHIPANLFRNNSQLVGVGLNKNSIEAIDEFLFENNSLLQLVALDLNHLVELPENLFRNNSMLEFVRASKNFLERISERTFESNTRLRKIYLDGNNLSWLPSKLFQNNSLLEIVHLENNSLEAIEEHTFRTNVNLQAVYLNLNKLTDLPETLFHNNPLLEIVDLSDNLFKTLNENIFRENANLKKLLLQKCLLESLPEHLFQGTFRLEYVSLSNNLLKTIKTNFTNLKHVTFMDLIDNVCVVDIIFFDGIIEIRRDRFLKGINNLTEFQGTINDRCTQY